MKKNKACYQNAGKHIRERRKQLNISRYCISSRTGISPSRYAQIESGTRPGRLDEYLCLADALETTIGELVYGIKQYSFGDDCIDTIVNDLKHYSYQELDTICIILDALKRMHTGDHEKIEE